MSGYKHGIFNVSIIFHRVNTEEKNKFSNENGQDLWVQEPIRTLWLVKSILVQQSVFCICELLAQKAAKSATVDVTIVLSHCSSEWLRVHFRLSRNLCTSSFLYILQYLTYEGYR